MTEQQEYVEYETPDWWYANWQHEKSFNVVCGTCGMSDVLVIAWGALGAGAHCLWCVEKNMVDLHLEKFPAHRVTYQDPFVKFFEEMKRSLVNMIDYLCEHPAMWYYLVCVVITVVAFVMGVR